MSTSDITSKLFIAPGVPATRNKAGYEALTWTQVKGIVSIGATGTTNSPIEVPDLETGFTLAVKGARAGNVVAVAMREVKADEGQPTSRPLLLRLLPSNTRSRLQSRQRRDG